MVPDHCEAAGCEALLKPLKSMVGNVLEDFFVEDRDPGTVIGSGLELLHDP